MGRSSLNQHPANNPAVYINGEWSIGSGPLLENRCPSTGNIVWSGSASSAEDVHSAIKSAKQAFKLWSTIPVSQRIRILERYALALSNRKTEIATAISRDMGKPLQESHTEVSAMVGKIAISIKAFNKRSGNSHTVTDFGAKELRHRPHGIFAVFGPFNFPGHLPNGHLVPALLAGNTCIFKPSEQAPSVAHLIADAFEEAGLPKGCLSVVQGGKDTGAALLDADIDGVLFTGSAATGKFIHQKFAGRPEVILALEMGGNNPLIASISDNAVSAAEVIFQSAYITSGQRCTCARRLIIPESHLTPILIERLAERIRSVEVGTWDANDVFMGPLVSEQAAKAALQYEEMLINRGGTPVVRFKQDANIPALLRPALIDVTSVAELPDEELFAPLLQIIRVETDAQALERANDTRYGLAAGVITEDADLWVYYRDRLKAGILNWNRPTTGASSDMPFGGPGLSGNHRPSAYYAADYCAWPQATLSSAKL